MWGKGRLQKNDSEWYEGGFHKNDKLSSNDVIIHTKNGKYEGPILDGKMNG